MEQGSLPKVESSTPFEKKLPLVEVDAQRRSPDPTRGGSACCEVPRKGEGVNKDVPLFGGQFSSLLLVTLHRGAGVPPQLPALWYGWKRPSMLGVEGMMLRKEGQWTRIGPGVGRDMGKLNEEGRARGSLHVNLPWCIADSSRSWCGKIAWVRDLLVTRASPRREQHHSPHPTKNV